MPKKKKRSNNSSFPTILFVGGGIALIAAALIFFSQNSNPAPVAEAPIGEGIPYPEIARVSLAESKSALDSGSAILLDVRSADAFAGQHITGAVNIPVNDLGARLGELDPNAWIIPYCTWPSEELSARAASILLENGFSNVTPMLGGFAAWIDAGYPTAP